MNRFTYILIVLLFSSKLNSQVLNLDSIKSKYSNTDTTVYIYMTALWCSPCLDKMPYYDAFFSKTKKPYKIIYLFDIEKFSNRELKRIFPFIDFSNCIAFIPEQFYPTAIIQINSHNRMFKNFIKNHKEKTWQIKGIENFNLSSFIVLPPRENAFVIDAPTIKEMKLIEVESLFDSILVQNK
jgi:thiol-disulfide isomerase/thioredoxin